MRHRDTLGLAGRTGGIDDVSRHCAPDIDRKVILAFGCYGRRNLIKINPRRVCACREDVLEAGFSDQHLHLGVILHEGNSFSRITLVKGNVGGAGFQDRQQRYDKISGAFEIKPDKFSWPRTSTLQVTGKLIGTRVEFLVSELAGAVDDRARGRSARCLTLKKPVNRDIPRKFRTGAVPFHQKLVALGR